jgi:predicted transcriptional regulator
MYYEIDSDDEALQRAVKKLFEWYDKFLSEDLRKVLEKLRDTKPDTLTDDEGETLIDAYNTFQDLKETIGEITEILYPED